MAAHAMRSSFSEFLLDTSNEPELKKIILDLAQSVIIFQGSDWLLERSRIENSALSSKIQPPGKILI